MLELGLNTTFFPVLPLLRNGIPHLQFTKILGLMVICAIVFFPPKGDFTISFEEKPELWLYLLPDKPCSREKQEDSNAFLGLKTAMPV